MTPDQTNVLGMLLDDASRAGATYAEARATRLDQDVLLVSDGRIDTAHTTNSEGVGVRVLVDGAWGFAATSDERPDAIRRIVPEAIAIARASAAKRREPVVFAPAPRVVAAFRDLGTIDPLATSIEDRMAIAAAAHNAMRSVDGISHTRVHMDLRREWSELRTTEGTRVTQEIGVVGGGFIATADVRGTVAKRSFPHFHGWDYGTGGFEWFMRQRWSEEATRIAREAVLLTSARPAPLQTTTVILDPGMLGLLLHETLGHPSELDRVFSDELDWFGPTFLTPDKLNRFPYASPIVSITADATMPGGPGSFGFDDEGVAAQRIPLVTNGILTDHLTSRECAARIGKTSNGTARASSWNRIPTARVTNLVVQPGTSTLERMIGEVDEGIYIQTVGPADIDDRRLLCSFGGEIGWEIKHGKLGDPVRAPVLFTNTPYLWRQCDAVGSAAESQVFGIAECGKGMPLQLIRTGQGGPPVRFRNVRVGLP